MERRRVMTEPTRIGPDEAHRKVKSGTALFVCAYDDEQKFRNMRLEGAISLSELRARLPSLSKEQEIIFYCA
jgi:rhodanese-related sulfurtransferase